MKMCYFVTVVFDSCCCRGPLMNNLTLHCIVKFGKVFDLYFSRLLQVSVEDSWCCVCLQSAHIFWCADSAEVDFAVCL